MENTWQTFGHLAVKNILQRQLTSKNFPHAYLFLGSEGVGKKTLALEFAGKILNFNKERLHINPDFVLFEAQGNDQEIDRLREFTARLNLKPALGGVKVAIIDNAQHIKEKNSNTLLKAIEEPAGKAVIILIAAQGALLPTIISRCQVLHFNLFSKNQLKNFAQSRGLELKNEVIFDLSFGRIGRLKELAQNAEALSREIEAVENLKKIKAQNAALRLLEVSRLGKFEGADLKKMFLTWLFWEMGELKKDIAGQRAVRVLMEALRGLNINKSKKLVLQGLLMGI